MKKRIRKSQFLLNAQIDTLSSEKTARINELKAENAKIMQELDAYRAREKEIAETLTFARKKSDEFIAEAKVKYALECERLKIYRKKWECASENGGENGISRSFKKTADILRECQLELETMLASDLGEDFAAYLAERNRINGDPTLDYAAIAPTLSNADNFPDMLTEEEIEELLRQL